MLKSLLQLQKGKWRLNACSDMSTNCQLEEPTASAALYSEIASTSKRGEHTTPEWVGGKCENVYSEQVYVLHLPCKCELTGTAKQFTLLFQKCAVQMSYSKLH